MSDRTKTKNQESTKAQETRPAKPAVRRNTGSEERMAHLVKDAYRGLSRSLQAGLKEHSVLYGHWTFLRILWQTDGVTQRQLSEQAGVMEPTTFAALQSMEKLGYVTRQKMQDNRKQVRAFLTPKGAALRSVLVPVAEEINRIALEGVTDKDAAITRRTLLTIIENLAEASFAAQQATDTASRSRDGNLEKTEEVP